MTKEEFLEKLPEIKPWYFIFVRVKSGQAPPSQYGSTMTEYGTGEFCHVEVRLPDTDEEGDIVITANGKLVCIEKLKKYLTNPECFQLHIKRLRGLTTEDMEYMKVEAERQIKSKMSYDWTGIGGMALKSALTKIPLVGFFINKIVWKLPNIHDSGKLFCTESAARIGRAPKKVINGIAGNAKYDLPVTVPPAVLADDPNFETVLVIG